MTSTRECDHALSVSETPCTCSLHLPESVSHRPPSESQAKTHAAPWHSPNTWLCSRMLRSNRTYLVLSDLQKQKQRISDEWWSDDGFRPAEEAARTLWPRWLFARRCSWPPSACPFWTEQQQQQHERRATATADGKARTVSCSFFLSSLPEWMKLRCWLSFCCTSSAMVRNLWQACTQAVTTEPVSQAASVNERRH